MCTESLPRTKSISDFLWIVCSNVNAWAPQLEGDRLYLHCLSILIILLDHVDRFLHISEYQIAMTIVGLRNQSVQSLAHSASKGPYV